MEWSDVLNRLQEFAARIGEIQDEYVAFWAQNVLLTWRWWLKIAMLVLPWAVWFIIRKKDSTARLLLAGFFAMAATVYLDEMGVSMGLWVYSGRINPYVSESSAYNLSIIPVSVMLLVQLFPRIRPVVKALIFAALGAFVLLPLMTFLGYFKRIHWSYAYSFPILFAIYWASHRLALMRSFEPPA
jgi:hypothetical protein